MTAADDVWKGQLETLGAFIRTQRQLARLSLREMANLTDVSNAYLSQIERGLHQPSIRVVRSLADALNVSAETLLARAGLIDLDDDETAPAAADDSAATVAAILADSTLTPEQKDAVLSVYRTFSGSGIVSDEPNEPHDAAPVQRPGPPGRLPG